MSVEGSLGSPHAIDFASPGLTCKTWRTWRTTSTMKTTAAGSWLLSPTTGWTTTELKVHCPWSKSRLRSPLKLCVLVLVWMQREVLQRKDVGVLLQQLQNYLRLYPRQKRLRSGNSCHPVSIWRTAKVWMLHRSCGTHQTGSRCTSTLLRSLTVGLCVGKNAIHIPIHRWWCNILGYHKQGN